MAEGNSGDGNNRSVLTNAVVALNGIWNALRNSFPQITGLSASATAGGAALPATPEGFITMVLPTGQTVKVPYYLE